MPFVVGRKFGPATVRRWYLRSLATRAAQSRCKWKAGGANRMDPAPNSPTVKLIMGLEPFNALGTGRWSAEHTLGNGLVAIAGDRALGERIVGEMNFLV